MIEQTYFLDMIPGESTPPVVHVSQFDVKSRTLTFNLMKGGVAYVPDAGMSVTLDGMKPDNTVFSYPMTVDGSSVSIDVLTQMTVVSGHVRCEVSVSNQTGKIGSANFILAVEESPIDSGSISESDIPIFEDLKNQAQQAAASAEQSASDAEDFATDAETAASSVSAILPASAGTTGQVLTKTATGADWVDNQGLPSGGTAGQVLTKNSSTDGDASWQTPQSGGGGTWGSITGTLSDQTDLQNALNAKANTSTLATVESTTTASQAYSVGDYLVLNGQLYEVTTAITSGETLTVGTNISATTVGDELTALNNGLTSTSNVLWEWETFQGTVGGVAQTFYRKRLGNVYIMFGAGSVNVALGTGATSQRQIVYADKPFTAVYGGAANLSVGGQVDSYARYVAVGRDRVDAWLYNPAPTTAPTMVYNFIVIGTAS